MERRDFFISYTKTDTDSAVWIAETLKSNGYSVYVQALDIHPGDNFLEKMEEFLENSANFIAVWSKNYSKSDYCMQEFRAAFTACHAKEMGCLLPVRIEDYPLKRLYSSLVHVDLFGKDVASEAELMNAVRYVVHCPKIDVITVTFLHPSTEQIIEAEVDINTSATAIINELVACNFIPDISPDEMYVLLCKNTQKRFYGTQTLRDAGATNHSVIRVISAKGM